MRQAGDGKGTMLPANTKTLLAHIAPDPWSAATAEKRKVADARMVVLGVALRHIDDGATVNSVAEMLNEQLQNRLTTAQQMALQSIQGDIPSLPTLKRWLSAYKTQGKVGLLPNHTGRQRADYGWEARAIELFNKPSKPNYSDVAFRLTGEGFENVTVTRVKTYLQSLPATLGKNSPHRVGKKLHKLTKQNHVERHMDDLKVGDVYAADGHTVDCYVAHPETGGLFRPELTVFLDLKSRYVVGWWISESESTTTTLFALSNALTTHNHVPLFVYVDQGSGYKSKLMTDEVTGFYAKFNIEPIFAMPGNPHGKGWVERFFLTIRNRHDKFFDDGMAYCGDDMAPEINRRLSVELKNGRRQVKSLAQYVDSLKQFFTQYVNTPMPKALNGKTPLEVFTSLERVGVGISMDAVARPSVMRMVTRQSVTLDKRRYFSEALALFDGKTVRVEYDMHDDAHVWISDESDRHICVADITQRVGVISHSRLEDQRQKRKDGQLKRLKKHADEAQERAKPAIDYDALANRLETAQPELIDADVGRAIGRKRIEIDIDIYNKDQS